MQKFKHLDLSTSWKQKTELMEKHIKQKAVTGEPLHILEAGCGHSWGINLEGIQYVLTGVDVDKAALEIRKNVLKDLHKIIEGDLRYVDFGESQFDVIYSSFVLEHIEGAEAVLNSFLKWLKPNGVIIINIPDPNSVQGFITRVTPHWFHVFVYCRIFGDKNAGRAGYGPYRTYYDPVVSRRGIHNFCRENNLSIKAEYGEPEYWKPDQGIFLAIHLFKRIVNILSFGLLSYRHTNLLYILQKEQI